MRKSDRMREENENKSEPSKTCLDCWKPGIPECGTQKFLLGIYASFIVLVACGDSSSSASHALVFFLNASAAL